MEESLHYQNHQFTLLPSYGRITIILTILFNIIYVIVVLWPNYGNIKYLLLNIGWNTYIAYSLLFNFCNIIASLLEKRLKNSYQLLYIILIGCFLIFNYFSLIQHAIRFYNFYTIDYSNLRRIQNVKKLQRPFVLKQRALNSVNNVVE